MLINKNEHKSSLAVLWNRVFGDDLDFIEFIFKEAYANSVLCFAELDGDNAVSAFYLIRNTLKYNNKFYDGYYLYAAATLPEYRKSGIMSRLIGEALDFCREHNVDFVSLVPSEEGLYGYYSRFGFEKAMYRYENSADKINALKVSETVIDINEILKIRNSADINLISFHPDSFGYAYDCLVDSGFRFRKISDDSYILYSEDDDFSEFISSENRLDENEKRLGRALKSVTSPFALKSFDSYELKPFGMLYPVNSELKRQWSFTDIYMNIALD